MSGAVCDVTVDLHCDVRDSHHTKHFVFACLRFAHEIPSIDLYQFEYIDDLSSCVEIVFSAHFYDFLRLILIQLLAIYFLTNDVICHQSYTIRV